MKYLFIILILANAWKGFSQIEPEQNYEEVLKKGKLKSIKTMFYTSEDTTQSEGRVLFRKEFDRSGKLIEKFVYTFWDVVSYTHTSSFIYDSNANLIESTVIQKILNLGKRDEEYIKEFGDEPINVKRFFTYNDKKQLINLLVYSFGREAFDKSQNPTNSIDYQYNTKGLLIKEIEKGYRNGTFEQNTVTTYEYNQAGKKIKEVRSFNDGAKDIATTITYLYNDKGLMIEEESKGSDGFSLNDSHLKYEYNKNGKLANVLSYSSETQKWTVYKTYDKDGKLINMNEETNYDYYDNNLIKRELWKSSKSSETVNFISFYEFY